MNGGRAALLARRAHLVARAAAERDEIARQLGAWNDSWSGVGKSLGFMGSLAKHAPVLGMGLGLGLSAILLARPAIVIGLHAVPAALRLTRSIFNLHSAVRPR